MTPEHTNERWDVEDEDLDKERDGDEDGEDEHAAQTIQVKRSSPAPSRVGVYQSSHLRMMFISNLSMSGMDTRVMRTMTDPIPMVAYLAEVSLRPVVMNRLVE